MLIFWIGRILLHVWKKAEVKPVTQTKRPCSKCNIAIAFQIFRVYVMSICSCAFATFAAYQNLSGARRISHITSRMKMWYDWSLMKSRHRRRGWIVTAVTSFQSLTPPPGTSTCASAPGTSADSSPPCQLVFKPKLHSPACFPGQLSWFQPPSFRPFPGERSSLLTLSLNAAGRIACFSAVSI